LAAALQIGFLEMTGRTLDAFALLPEEVLKHLRDHLGLRIPQQRTTLRDLYGRGQTLREHHRWAAQRLGFRPFTDRRQRVLPLHVREAHNAVTIQRLVEFAKRWLCERRIRSPQIVGCGTWRDSIRRCGTGHA
jgi:hypothetical protein